MNPQMQQYRHAAYPQGQPRGVPQARRPGECDSSTSSSLNPPRHPVTDPRSQHQLEPASCVGGRVLLPSGIIHRPTTTFVPARDMLLRPLNNILPQYHHTIHSVPFQPFAYPSNHARLQSHPHRQIDPHLHPAQYSNLSQTASYLNSASVRAMPINHQNARLQGWNKVGPMPPNYAHPNAAAAAVQHAQQMQNATAQQRHALLEHQSAQRRAKKPTDKTLPDGIDELLVAPNIGQQYRELRDAEKRLDYSIMRKRTDLSDTFSRTVKRQKTMRIWISNTAENQPWQGGGLDENAFDFTSGNDPTFRVKVEGRLLDEPDDDIFASDDEEESEEKEEKKPSPKFTHFFDELTVDFDRTRQGGMDASMQVEWKKPKNFSDVDELAFSRRGDENMNITINLRRHEYPDRYRLSHALAQTLDVDEADKPETVMGLWEYVKVMGLQGDDDKRQIHCDDNLRQIFGREQVSFPQIPDLITPHLHPLPPVKLPYTIHVDQAYLNDPEPTVYDIRVSVEDPIRTKVVTMMQNPEYLNQLRQIARLDDELAVVIQSIQHSKSKHVFYKQMSRDPVGFVKKWMSSQQRDLEVILGEAARGGGEDGMGVEFARGGEDGVWGSELTREAVRYLLAKNVVVKS